MALDRRVYMFFTNIQETSIRDVEDGEVEKSGLTSSYRHTKYTATYGTTSSGKKIESWVTPTHRANKKKPTTKRKC